MNTKKSINELIGDSFATLKESFWGLCATFCVLIFFAIVLVFLSKALNIPLKDMQHNPGNLGPMAILINLFFALISLVLYIWQILIIKNNIFTATSQFGDALKAAFVKTPKVILVMVPMVVLFILILLPLITFLSYPFFIMIPLGIILQDTNLKSSLVNAFNTTITYYFQILLRLLALVLLYILLMIPLIILGIVFGFTILRGPLFLFIAVAFLLLYVFMYAFTFCYFVEMYLDLATEEQSDLDINNDDVQNVNLDYDELPSKNGKPEVQGPLNPESAPQQTYKEEPPEGLRPLGGNYEDKN